MGKKEPFTAGFKREAARPLSLSGRLTDYRHEATRGRGALPSLRRPGTAASAIPGDSPYVHA